MSAENQSCPKCNRKIMQSISNRCMYCGAALPEEHHLSQEEKNRLLNEKLEQFRQTEENADKIISNMRRDFGMPAPKKSRKQRKQDSAEAMAAAIANLNAQDGSGRNSNNNNSG